MNKEELKILIYRYLNELEYMYTYQMNTFYKNLKFDVPENPTFVDMVLEYYSAKCQKEAVDKVSADIRRILDSDGKLC